VAAVVTRAERLNHLIAEHRTCLARAEESERRYADVVAVHLARAATVPGRSAVIAEQRAANDSRLRTAVSDGAWYRDKATMCGIAVLVELMAGGEL